MGKKDNIRDGYWNPEHDEGYWKDALPQYQPKEQKNIRPKIEDIICEYFDDNEIKKQDALNMVAYLKSIGMSFTRGGVNSWTIKKSQKSPALRIKICSGSWFVLVRGQTARDMLTYEEIKEINWKSFNFCSGSGCSDCKPGIELDVFGKKFTNVCRGRMFEYRDPSAEVMKILKDILDKRFAFEKN